MKGNRSCENIEDVAKHITKHFLPFIKRETLAGDVADAGRRAAIEVVKYTPQAESEIAEHKLALQQDLASSLRNTKLSFLDEEELADVITLFDIQWHDKFKEYKHYLSTDPGPKADYIARAIIEWLKEKNNENRKIERK